MSWLEDVKEDPTDPTMWRSPGGIYIPGSVVVPAKVKEAATRSTAQQDKARRHWDEAHECCPECGGDQIAQTTMGSLHYWEEDACPVCPHDDHDTFGCNDGDPRGECDCRWGTLYGYPESSLPGKKVLRYADKRNRGRCECGWSGPVEDLVSKKTRKNACPVCYGQCHQESWFDDEGVEAWRCPVCDFNNVGSWEDGPGDLDTSWHGETVAELRGAWLAQ